MIEFGYYYYDSPTAVIGPLPEEVVQKAADKDSGIQVVYRNRQDGEEWYLFEYKSQSEIEGDNA